MFPYPCPSCDQRLLAPAERAGQRTICPKCLRPLTIPQFEGNGSEDPKTMVDPSEMPLPVMADTHTPFPGSIRMPNFAAVEVSCATAVAAAPVELRAAYTTDDLTFELPEVSTHSRGEVSESSQPRPTVTDTPAPNPARLPIRSRRATNPDALGMVMLNPTGLFAVDRAAELSAAISMRMKPPPEHSADRRLIVGAWAFGTLAALALWLGGLFYNPECLPFVALVGGAMLAFGLLWRAYLISQDESVFKGVLCLLPPFNLLRLFQKSGDNGFRPLRFAASGAVALALFSTGASARSYVESRSVSPGNDTGFAINATKLQAASDKPDRLLKAIAEIAPAEVAVVSTTEDKQATIAELQKLLKHERGAVRLAAIGALRTWSEADAKQWVLSELRGRDRDTALAAAGQFADPDIVAALGKMLQTRECRYEAQRALIAIGKPAEASLMESLTTANDAAALSIIEVLVQIGGAKSLVALRRLAELSPSPIVKPEANAAADQLAGKLSK